MNIKIICLGLFLLLPLAVVAQTAPTGTLDSTFNPGPSNGKLLVDSLRGNLGAMAIDKMGRIVAVSYDPADRTIHIRRVLATGMNDKSFGINGYKKISSTFAHSVNSVAIQSDNKILIGGGKPIAVGSAIMDMYLLRLRENGSEDTEILGSGFWNRNFGGSDQVEKMYVQNDGKILLAGKSTGGITLARLKSDASLDESFGGGKGYTGLGTSMAALGSLDLDNANNIYIAGSDSVGNYKVVKLHSSGEKNNNFGDMGVASISSYGSVPVGVGIQANGKIVIAGSNTPYQYTAARFKADGKIDTAYGNNFNGMASYSCYYSNMRNLLLQKDGKVLIGGIYSGNEYRLMKLTTQGTLDSTFGVYGQATYGGAPSAVQYVLSPDNKVFIFGKQGVYFYINKAITNPVIHILGSAYAFPKSVEKYSIKVPSSYLSTTVYNWSYTGNGTVFVGGSTGTNVNLFFSENASSGKLRCVARTAGGVVLGFEEMDVLININANAARQLASLQCTPGISNCSGSYIDLFQLNKTRNTTQGCSNNGYTDFTPSNYTDTLYVGGVYSAKLKLGGEGIRYVSMWIDYNNDGFFNSSDEYLGESSTNNSIVDINNIVFKNAEGYEGPKRLRVRCRAQEKFNPEESCPTNGEIGETEDYLVVIQRQSTLEAPQIITPNEDGKNDYFVIRGVDPSSDSKLIIFDRTGKVKFTTDNYENNWNGVATNGEKLLPGTYYYVFTNKDESLKGFLEIRY